VQTIIQGRLEFKNLSKRSVKWTERSARKSYEAYLQRYRKEILLFPEGIVVYCTNKTCNLTRLLIFWRSYSTLSATNSRQLCIRCR